MNAIPLSFPRPNKLLSPRDVSNRYGVPYGVALQLCRRYGIKLSDAPKGRRYIHPETADRVVKGGGTP